MEKKKIEIEIPTLKQRDRREFDKEIRDDYKRADLLGYGSIRKD